MKIQPITYNIKNLSSKSCLMKNEASDKQVFFCIVSKFPFFDGREINYRKSATRNRKPAIRTCRHVTAPRWPTHQHFRLAFESNECAVSWMKRWCASRERAAMTSLKWRKQRARWLLKSDETHVKKHFRLCYNLPGCRIMMILRKPWQLNGVRRSLL